ncbi:unnamed protein product [Rhodiola kirilowii]
MALSKSSHRSITLLIFTLKAPPTTTAGRHRPPQAARRRRPPPTFGKLPAISSELPATSCKLPADFLPPLADLWRWPEVHRRSAGSLQEMADSPSEVVGTPPEVGGGGGQRWAAGGGGRRRPEDVSKRYRLTHLPFHPPAQKPTCLIDRPSSVNNVVFTPPTASPPQLQPSALSQSQNLHLTPHHQPMAAASSLSLSSNLTAAAVSLSATRKSALLRSINPNSVSFRLPISVDAPLRVSGAARLLKVCASSAQVVMDNKSTSETTNPTVVEVDLGNRSYPIYIGSGLLDQPDLLQKHVHGKRVLVVTNTTVAPLYLSKVVHTLTVGNPNVTVESVILPDGEKYKDMDTLMKIFDKAIESRLDRRCTFVALGGGVIGDMCGYAAASFLRGVNFIQIPTTVMAQVDSSVGGKTGINHRLGKNLIGAFYQPQCVLIDTDTLNTLPERELASGLAEVIKYGLIRDADFFEWQEKNIKLLLARDPTAMTYAIKKSCENKAEVVSLDEREGGLRATLNLGHTFGHAIETGLGYGEWLHGEAVAAGTVMAVDMSYRLGWIDESLVKRVLKILTEAKLPTTPPESVTVETFKSVMAVDKKVADGLLRLILLKGPLGNCVFTGEYDRKALDETLHAFAKP